MKKIIYTLLFVFTASLTITACTEEEVKPARDTTVTGSNVSETM